VASKSTKAPKSAEEAKKQKILELSNAIAKQDDCDVIHFKEKELISKNKKRVS